MKQLNFVEQQQQQSNSQQLELLQFLVQQQITLSNVNSMTRPKYVLQTMKSDRNNNQVSNQMLYGFNNLDNCNHLCDLTINQPITAMNYTNDQDVNFVEQQQQSNSQQLELLQYLLQQQIILGNGMTMPKYVLPSMKSDRNHHVFNQMHDFNNLDNCNHLCDQFINQPIAAINYANDQHINYATDLIGSKLNDYRKKKIGKQIIETNRSVLGDFTSSESFVDFWFERSLPFFHVIPENDDFLFEMNSDQFDLMNSPEQEQPNSGLNVIDDRTLNVNTATNPDLLAGTNLSPSNPNTLNALFNGQLLSPDVEVISAQPPPKPKRLSYSQAVKSKSPAIKVVPNSLETTPYSSRETTPDKTSSTPLTMANNNSNRKSTNRKLDLKRALFANHPQSPEQAQCPESPVELAKKNEELSRENVLFKSMCKNLLDRLFEVTVASPSSDTRTTPNSNQASPSSGRRKDENNTNHSSPALEKLLPQAKLHRTAANYSEAKLNWTGDLPDKTIENAEYSCKVFLGGIPWGITESDFVKEFKNFGKIKLQWPGKEVNCTARGEPSKAGYVYGIFENQAQVKKVLNNCLFRYDAGEGKWYWQLKAVKPRKYRQDRQVKEIEIKPWNLNDGYHVVRKVDNFSKCKTLFVGNLHGRITAKALAIIIDERFGDVVSVNIDTDKNK